MAEAAIFKSTPKDKREVTLNPSIKLPRDRYTVRIKEESFEISKASGNPMIVLTCELVSPDSFVNPVDGGKVNIGGVELAKKYVVLSSKKGEAEAQANFDRYADMRDKLGVPIGDEGVDINNPPKVFVGKVIDAICDGEEFIQRKDPTPDQRAKGEQGNPITDTAGNQIKSYKPIIVNILGLADGNGASNKPF
jgi:hypothetical protein